MDKLLFVYGSLKKGGKLNETLDYIESEYIKDITLDSSYNLSLYVPSNKGNYPFPAVIKSVIGNNIKGELYTIKDKYLNYMDRVECVPDLYTREIINVEDKEVFIYLAKFNIQGMKLSDSYDVTVWS